MSKLIGEINRSREQRHNLRMLRVILITNEIFRRRSSADESGCGVGTRFIVLDVKEKW